jgi:hypothetical protein
LRAWAKHVTVRVNSASRQFKAGFAWVGEPIKPAGSFDEVSHLISQFYKFIYELFGKKIQATKKRGGD